MIDVAANVRRIRERADAAMRRAGREPSTLRIIAVAKTKPAAMIRAAYEAGLHDIGENYVQEAQAARAELADLPLRWHMIGHLQRNKARRAVALFDVIQTVDGVDLGKLLSRQAVEAGRTLSVLLEVNLGSEATKSGIAPAEVANVLAELARLPNLSVDGLMAIPPPVTTPELARPAFRKLRELRDTVLGCVRPAVPLRELSMGMTDDFEIAIEEGATMIRVGRALFGERAN
jgi:pyridoxal phosphate enzyme (YggS family)